MAAISLLCSVRKIACTILLSVSSSIIRLGHTIEVILINPKGLSVLFQKRVREDLVIDNAIFVERVCARHYFDIILLPVLCSLNAAFSSIFGNL